MALDIVQLNSTVTALANTVKSLTKTVDKMAAQPNYGGGRDTVPAEPVDRKGRLTKGFKSPREFIQMVYEAYDLHKGDVSKVDKRLAGMLAKTAGSDEQMVVNDPYGGFLVPPAYSPELLKIDPEDDPMGGRTRKMPMGAPVLKINARVDKNHTTSVSGGFTVARKIETAAAAASRGEFEQIELNANSLFGFAYATEELMTDSPQSFAAIIAAGFSDQFNYKIIDERINGTGIGEYLGVLNSPALVSVTKDSGQDAATVTFTNVVNMRSRCWGYSQAIWLANHDVMPQLLTLNQQIGLGGVPVWQPSAREDHPDMLFGRPLIFTEYCKTVGTVGDILLVNWNEYLEGIYQPMKSDESIHVRFDRNERAFRFSIRNAGAPWWRTALTTKNSTNTLSPYVALATRA